MVAAKKFSIFAFVCLLGACSNSDTGSLTTASSGITAGQPAAVPTVSAVSADSHSGGSAGRQAKISIISASSPNPYPGGTAGKQPDPNCEDNYARPHSKPSGGRAYLSSAHASWADHVTGCKSKGQGQKLSY